MKTIKIGIVDDHLLFLDGFTNLLKKNDTIEIVFASSDPLEAIELLKTNSLDLIITDISMPQLNGIEFIHHIKKNYADLKIVVISTFDDIDSLHFVDGYLSKDVAIEEVFETIAKILNDEKVLSKNLDKSKALHFERVLLGTREKEIIKLIIDELTTDEIAEKLFISKSTVETHRRNIFIKLQVSNIAGMTKKAIQLGLI